VNFSSVGVLPDLMLLYLEAYPARSLTPAATVPSPNPQLFKRESERAWVGGGRGYERGWNEGGGVGKTREHNRAKLARQKSETFITRHAPLALSHERPAGVSLEEDSEISTPLHGNQNERPKKQK